MLKWLRKVQCKLFGHKPWLDYNRDGWTCSKCGQFEPAYLGKVANSATNAWWRSTGQKPATPEEHAALIDRLQKEWAAVASSTTKKRAS